MADLDLGVLGHHIASEAVHRVIHGKALGTPSLYNIIREAAVDMLERDLDPIIREQVKQATRYIQRAPHRG